MTDINLIPETEAYEQQRSKLVKVSTIIAIVFLVVISIVSGVLFYTTNNLNNQIKSLDVDIQNLRSEIKLMSDIEISARNLYKKYTVLQSLLNERIRYSSLVIEVRRRQPEALLVQDMDVKNGKMNISGVTNDYVSISNFVNNLLDKNFSEGNPDLKEVFTAVALNSVSLEGSTNKVKFFIVVDFDSGKLK